MNTQSFQLISILLKCNQNDRQLNKEVRIQSILGMESYVELSHRAVFKNLFNDLFVENKLRTYDDAKLDKIIEALPCVPYCADNIIFSLKNGDCSQLTSKDIPNFFEKDSLVSLAKRLERSSGKNYCNIAPEEYLTIFDDDTIKSIEPYFDQLPYGCEDYCAAIDALLAPKKYCINENEILRLNDSFRELESSLLVNIEESEHRKFKLSMIKLLICMACIAMPSLYSLSSGNVSNSMSIFATVVMAALSAVYYFKG